MSKIEDMIRDLCPDGVKKVKLGEVCEIKRGVRVVKNELDSSEGYPVYQNSLSVLGYYPEYNTPANTTFVISAGAAGKIGFSDSDFWAADDCLRIFCPDYLKGKYAYYCMLNNENYFTSQVRKASVPRLSREVVDRFEFPLPPLPIQEKIVEILEKFSLLSAELEAELEGRRKQYDFYRNRLLSFDSGSDSVQWKTLGEVGPVRMCKRILKSETNTTGGIPFYKIGTFGKECDAYISQELFEEYKAKYSYPTKGTILLSAAGTIGKTVVFDGEPSYFQDSNIVWIENDESMVLNRYLLHFFKVVSWKVDDGGVVKRLYNDNLRNTPIPVPPLAEQERIVRILDKFEALVTDLSAGLPAEIERVQKQYEYYRNKLFTFPEA